MGFHFQHNSYLTSKNSSIIILFSTYRTNNLQNVLNSFLPDIPLNGIYERLSNMYIKIIVFCIVKYFESNCHFFKNKTHVVPFRLLHLHVLAVVCSLM